MADLLFLTGCAVGTILLTLLAMTVAGAPLRVWPLPLTWDFRSVVFWTLFRSLHVLTILVAAVDFALWDEGIPLFRVVGLVVACVSVIFYLFAGIWLGRENLYVGQGGLMTRGIYRYTRNPQYAAAIPASLGLGSRLLLTPRISNFGLSCRGLRSHGASRRAVARENLRGGVRALPQEEFRASTTGAACGWLCNSSWRVRPAVRTRAEPGDGRRASVRGISVLN